MIYRAIFLRNNKSEYYKNEELLFSAKANVEFHNLGATVSLFANNEMIFSFYKFDFLFFYNKLKILFQNFQNKIRIEKNKTKYVLIVENKAIFIKYSSVIFSEKIADIFIDNNKIGEIIRESSTVFGFNFVESTELEYYVLVLFSIGSVGITAE